MFGVWGLPTFTHTHTHTHTHEREREREREAHALHRTHTPHTAPAPTSSSGGRTHAAVTIMPAHRDNTNPTRILVNLTLKAELL